MTKKRVKKKMTMEYEKKPAKVLVPPEVLQKMCEDFAEAVRDKINSQLGSDRLEISLFHPYADQSVSILFKDTEAPEGAPRLCLGWEEGCDVDGTVDLLLTGQLEVQEPDDAGPE